jgi:hypothetical protein
MELLNSLKQNLLGLKESYERILRIEVSEDALNFIKIYDVILFIGKKRVDIRIAGKNVNGKTNNKTIKSWSLEKGRYLIMPASEYIQIFRLIRQIDRFIEVSPLVECSSNDYMECVNELMEKLFAEKHRIESLFKFSVDFNEYADVWLYRKQYKNGVFYQLRANAYNGKRKVAVKVPEARLDDIQPYISIYKALKRLNKVKKTLSSIIDILNTNEEKVN